MSSRSVLFNLCVAVSHCILLTGCPTTYRLTTTCAPEAAGSIVANPDAETYEEALRLYVGREKYDFNMFGLGAFQSRDTLVSTAEALGRPEDVERIVAAVVPGRN